MASPGTDPRLKSGLLPTRGAPGPQSRPGAGVPGRLARRLPGMEPPLRSCLTDDHKRRAWLRYLVPEDPRALPQRTRRARHGKNRR